MSKKGCSPDNTACEEFFGWLKNKFFYGEYWLGISLENFIEQLDEYFLWDNHDRIKLSIGGISIIKYRETLSCVV